MLDAAISLLLCRDRAVAEARLTNRVRRIALVGSGTTGGAESGPHLTIQLQGSPTVVGVWFPVVGVRVELRPFELSDVSAAHRIYSDERVMRWVGAGAVHHPEQTEAMLREYIAHQRLHGYSFWAVIERATGKLIGDAGLYTRALEVELGYTLGYEHWGKGYGTEAARLAVRAAFTELGVGELVALIRPGNEPSVAVATKLGFVARERVAAYGSEHLLFVLRRKPARACAEVHNAQTPRSLSR